MKLLEFWTNGDDHGFRDVDSVDAAEEGPVFVDAEEALALVAQQAARIAELEAELQRERDRRVEHRQMNQSLNTVVQKTESRIASAVALLDEWYKARGDKYPTNLAAETRDCLAGQPAAPTSAETELAQLRERVAKADARLAHALVVDVEHTDIKRQIRSALDAIRGK